MMIIQLIKRESWCILLLLDVSPIWLNASFFGWAFQTTIKELHSGTCIKSEEKNIKKSFKVFLFRFILYRIQDWYAAIPPHHSSTEQFQALLLEGWLLDMGGNCCAEPAQHTSPGSSWISSSIKGEAIPAPSRFLPLVRNFTASSTNRHIRRELYRNNITASRISQEELNNIRQNQTFRYVPIIILLCITSKGGSFI